MNYTIDVERRHRKKTVKLNININYISKEKTTAKVLRLYAQIKQHCFTVH